MANIIISKRSGYFSKPESGSQIDWNNPVTSGLVAAFLFNERAGSICNNLVNPRLNGVLTNVNQNSIWTKNSEGPCLNFDGSNDCLIVPDHYSFNFILGQKSFSISMALNIKIDETNNVRYISKTEDVSNGWHIVKGVSNNRFELSRMIAGTNRIRCFTPEAPVGITTKYIFSYSFPLDSGYIFTNGKNTGTQVDSVNALGFAVNTTLDIGNRNDQINAVNGNMNYCFIWSRLLTQQEILSHNSNPYAFILNRRKRVFFFLPSGAADNKTATLVTATISILTNITTAGKASNKTSESAKQSVRVVSNSPTASRNDVKSAVTSIVLASIKANAVSAAIPGGVDNKTAATVKITITISITGLTAGKVSNKTAALTKSVISAVTNILSTGKQCNKTAAITKSLTSIVLGSVTSSKIGVKSASLTETFITIKVNTTAGSIPAAGALLGIIILGKSRMQNTVNSPSRIDKYINNKSEMDTGILEESQLCLKNI